MRDVSTSLDITSRLLEDRCTLWVVAALIVVLFAIANLPWQLDDYDQAKQAFTSFEMVKEGHWLYQHTPHERVASKPPLVGWMSAALFAVIGSWEIAWRLPSLVAALALAVVLFRAAKDAYGKVAAVIAVGAFAWFGVVRRQARQPSGSAQVGKDVYYCPMHKTYHSDKPGNCPTCRSPL